MDSEVHDIIHQTLQDYPEQDRIVILKLLKSWYSSYRFSSNSMYPSMFSPQLIFSYLQSVLNSRNITNFSVKDNIMQSMTVLAIANSHGPDTQDNFFWLAINNNV
jgi:hypothetical protein